MSHEKSLDVTSTTDTKEKVSDVVVVGNPDMFSLLCKASSKEQGWMKSAKAYVIPGGVFVQVTTQQRNPDGSYAVAEALAFAPGNFLLRPEDNGDKSIVPSDSVF